MQPLIKRPQKRVLPVRKLVEPHNQQRHPHIQPLPPPSSIKTTASATTPPPPPQITSNNNAQRTTMRKVASLKLPRRPTTRHTQMDTNSVPHQREQQQQTHYNNRNSGGDTHNNTSSNNSNSPVKRIPSKSNFRVKLPTRRSNQQHRQMPKPPSVEIGKIDSKQEGNQVEITNNHLHGSDMKTDSSSISGSKNTLAPPSQLPAQSLRLSESELASLVSSDSATTSSGYIQLLGPDGVPYAYAALIDTPSFTSPLHKGSGNIKEPTGVVARDSKQGGKNYRRGSEMSEGDSDNELLVDPQHIEKVSPLRTLQHFQQHKRPQRGSTPKSKLGPQQHQQQQQQVDNSSNELPDINYRPSSATGYSGHPSRSSSASKKW
eukprot:m.198660 g.198660  ORF g.198660 m.198660 type:complete len:375 (-) comp13688_c0_seq1:104-1228(-)